MITKYEKLNLLPDRRNAVLLSDGLEQRAVASDGESTMTSLGFEEYARGKCGWGVKVYFAGFPNGGREVANCSWATCVSCYDESSERTEIFSSRTNDSIHDPNSASLHWIPNLSNKISKKQHKISELNFQVLIGNNVYNTHQFPWNNHEKFPAAGQFVQRDSLGAN